MYEKLVNYAAKQLELDPAEITPDATFESLGIDSLDIVEMIMDLESELGVELDLEDERMNPKYGIMAVKSYLQRARFAPDTTIELAGVPVGIYE